MTKKGYPGLVLVPPSDRTIVRRRFVRWSLVGLAIVWGLFAILSSLAPPDKRDCQTADTQASPPSIQADCSPTAASARQSPTRVEESLPVAENPPNLGTSDGQNSPRSSPPESTKLTNEHTADHPSNTTVATAHHTAEEHTVPAQPENKVAPPPPSNQPTRPNTDADHNAVAHAGSGSLPQPSASPGHSASDRKPVTQSGNGSAPLPAPHPPAKAAGNSTDQKLMAQVPKESASLPVPNHPIRAAVTAFEHKPTGHSASGAASSQASTKPVAPSAQTTTDRKQTTQPGNGTVPSQAPSQPARAVNASTEHKQPTHSLNGSAPHQASSQPVTPTHPSPDRKAVSQPGSGSSVSPHPTGTVNSMAGQSGNGASHDPSSSPSSHQDARLAEEGDAFAQYRLGRFYAQQGGSQIPEAVRWYKKASHGLRRLAEAGNGQAMYVLGVMYAYGRGVKRDTEQAKLWLTQALNHRITAARPVLASLEKD